MSSLRIFLCLTALAVLPVLTGCFDKDRDESKIPWARPASWEGAPPGMGSMGSPGGGMGR